MPDKKRQLDDALWYRIGKVAYILGWVGIGWVALIGVLEARTAASPSPWVNLYNSYITCSSNGHRYSLQNSTSIYQSTSSRLSLDDTQRALYSCQQLPLNQSNNYMAEQIYLGTQAAPYTIHFDVVNLGSTAQSNRELGLMIAIVVSLSIMLIIIKRALLYVAIGKWKGPITSPD